MKSLKTISVYLSILASALAIFLAVAPRANAVILGNPLQVVCITNSANILTNNIQVTVPAITETISQITNGVTQVTNIIATTFVTNGVTYTVTASYVFNATTWGLSGASQASPASWTTNYPTQGITVPAYTFFQAAPQAGGSNTVYILAQ